MKALSHLRRACPTAMVIYLAVLLNACTTAPITSLPHTPPTSIENLTHWQLEGKLGIRTAAKSGSLYINWLQNQDRFDINLAGSLGIGTTRIQGTPESATLSRPGEPTVSHPSPSELLAAQTGWYIPVDQLPYWVKGLPSPHTPYNAAIYDDNGTLDQFDQLGWHVQYQRRGQYGALNLPEKITVTQGETRITMVVKSWLLSARP